MKKATYKGVFTDLNRLGYETKYMHDCEQNNRGQYSLPDNVAVANETERDKTFNFPAIIYIHVHGNIVLGRKMNKDLKRKGYSTFIMKVRSKYMVFAVENDIDKLREI